MGGEVLVLDAGSGYIWRLSADGRPLGRMEGPGLAVYQPRGLSVGPSGDVYVSDTGGGRVLQLDAAGQIKSTIGPARDAAGSSEQPSSALELPSGGVLVADPQHRPIHYADMNRAYLYGLAHETLLRPWFRLLNCVNHFGMATHHHDSKILSTSQSTW